MRRIQTTFDVKHEEKLWIRHCNRFVRGGSVPRSFNDLPERIKTPRMKRFYKVLRKWILAHGNRYQIEKIGGK